MNTDFIKGVVVPILTPIDGEERIDEARLRDQVTTSSRAACPVFWPLAATASSIW